MKPSWGRGRRGKGHLARVPTRDNESSFIEEDHTNGANIVFLKADIFLEHKVHY